MGCCYGFMVQWQYVADGWCIWKYKLWNGFYGDVYKGYWSSYNICLCILCVCVWPFALSTKDHFFWSVFRTHQSFYDFRLWLEMIDTKITLMLAILTSTWQTVVPYWHHCLWYRCLKDIPNPIVFASRFSVRSNCSCLGKYHHENIIFCQHWR